jgi:hypothetical protein
LADRFFQVVTEALEKFNIVGTSLRLHGLSFELEAARFERIFLGHHLFCR